MRRPKVGIIAPAWPPEVMDNAGSLLVRHRVNELRAWCDVTLFVRDGYQASPHDLGVHSSVTVVDLPTPGPTTLLRRVSSFVSSTCRGEMIPASRVLSAWQARLAATSTEFDAVEVHWSQHFGIAPAIRSLFPRATLVAYAHDVMVQALRRRALASQSVARRWAARIAARRAESIEPTLLNSYDSVATFSDKDAALLRDLGVRSPIFVEQLYFHLPEYGARGVEPIVLFVGALYRPENDQAARWLIREIWPRVRRQVPDAELLIAGAGASAALRQVADRSTGVQVMGFVEDLPLLYSSAAVVVAPLMLGAGVKLKVIEALASGLPVVATTVGAEGLPPNLFGGISDDPVELARSIASLLQDPARRASLGVAGRSWARVAHKRLGIDISSAVRRYYDLIAESEV